MFFEITKKKKLLKNPWFTKKNKQQKGGILKLSQSEKWLIFSAQISISSLLRISEFQEIIDFLF